MKEFDAALKAVAEGLRTIAQGMEKIAEKLEDSVPKGRAKAKPVPKTKAKPKQKSAPQKKSPKNSAAVKSTVRETAADAVLKIISGTKNGVDSATLAEKTGFDKKKIANLVFKLRKQGKITSVDRGIYKTV